MLDYSKIEAIRNLRNVLEQANFSVLVQLVRQSISQDVPWPDYALLQKGFQLLGKEHSSLMKLFALGESVSVDEVKPLLSNSLITELEKAQLICSPQENIIQTQGYCIVPYQDILIVANPPTSFPTALKAQQDVCLDRDTFFLVKHLQGKTRQRALEICSGCGLLAIAASRSSMEVVGGELNPFAVSAARFNAVLNGVENKVRFYESDLFSNVTNSPYELILANPPYAATPEGSCNNFLAGDGGIDGLNPLRRILTGLDQQLSKQGQAMIVAGGFSQNGTLFFEAELRELAEANKWNITILLTDRMGIAEYIHQMTEFYDDKKCYRKKLEDYCSSIGATHWCAFYLRIGTTASNPILQVIDPILSFESRARVLRKARNK